MKQAELRHTSKTTEKRRTNEISSKDTSVKHRRHKVKIMETATTEQSASEEDEHYSDSDARSEAISQEMTSDTTPDEYKEPIPSTSRSSRQKKLLSVKRGLTHCK